MGERLELQELLEELLGSRNVYYCPPESVKMSYPAIVYSKDDIRKWDANDSKYGQKKKYTITVIDRRPDNEVIDALLNLEYSSYNRYYTSDNLNHDVITLYY